MNRLRRIFFCVILVGFSYYCGLVTNTIIYRQQRDYQHVVARENLASESRVISPTKLFQKSSGGNGDGPLADNINVAVLTTHPYWLFELRLNQSTPLIYGCQQTRRTISVKSAYLNATYTRGADVVIFSRSIDYRLWDQVLAERTPHQVWVYGSDESAYISPQVRNGDRPVGFNNFRFNMSFGYYSMSDVVAPFGEYVPLTKTEYSPLLRKLKQKTKLVAWASSHCDMQQWDRVGFVRRLSQFLPIDAFGRCGNLTLARGGEALKLRAYKFYLALENSCCSDYITEKFWKSLSLYEAVPIVIGAKKEEYEKVAPPNSFIYADDFDSMNDLAEYLRKVASDDELYGQFHEWRKKGEAKIYGNKRVHAFSSRESACALLEFIEKHAWKRSEHLAMTFDPYGPEWLGSCEICGDKTWMKSFDLNSDAYNPTMREKAIEPEYRFRNRLAEHNRRIAQEYAENIVRMR